MDQVSMMEEGNNEKIEQLGDMVDQMKKMSELIGDEIRNQDTLIDDVDSDISGARALIENGMKEMKKLIAQSGGGHMICLALFVMCFFFGIYWLARFK